MQNDPRLTFKAMWVLFEVVSMIFVNFTCLLINSFQIHHTIQNSFYDVWGMQVGEAAFHCSAWAKLNIIIGLHTHRTTTEAYLYLPTQLFDQFQAQ